jgi:hypothetical protein
MADQPLARAYASRLPAAWTAFVAVERAVVRVLGRNVVCRNCRQPIGRVLVVRWKGRLQLVGLRHQHVRVRFTGPQEVSVEHVEHCVRDL